MKRMGEIIESIMAAIGIAFIAGIVFILAGIITLVYKTIIKED